MNLQELGIFQLRAIGMKVGVKNPTKLKKQELINSIIKIECGELEPFKKKTNQGRPSKVIIDLPDKNLLNNTNLIDEYKKFLQMLKDFNISLNILIDNFLQKI